MFLANSFYQVSETHLQLVWCEWNCITAPPPASHVINLVFRKANCIKINSNEKNSWFVRFRLMWALLKGVQYVLIPILFCGTVCVFIHFPFGRNKETIHEPAAVYHSNTEYHNPLNSNASSPCRERALFKKLFVILQARVLCYYVTPSRSKSSNLLNR